MVNPWLFGTVTVSFFVTLITLPHWIKQAHKYKLVGKDIQKPDKADVAESGGIAVLLGTALGILSYVAINSFVFVSEEGNLVQIFALLSVLLISAIVGLMDDLLGWKKGLSRKIRLLIILFAAVPLMVIGAGNFEIYLPLIGMVKLGLLYPLIIIPLGVVGATTTFNFLAGWNGLEARQGILILSALAIITYIAGNSWLSLIALVMVAALIAFYLFNRYPAKVFPGDVMTYSVGAMIATIAILGNVEKIAVLFMIPYIIEILLKIRGGLAKESFGKLNYDNSLEQPYEKIYSLTHLSIKILKKIKPSHKVYEKDVVNFINALQAVIIVLAFWITGNL